MGLLPTVLERSTPTFARIQGSAYRLAIFQTSSLVYLSLLIVRTSHDWDTVGYTAGFDTVGDQWQTVCVPFSSLKPIFQARTVSDAPPFDPSNIVFVHLGSAGATRPDRPGLDLSKQPPAVRLNKELDFILTFKLKVSY
ncbi:NAD(P)-binding Rossmann-fold superfamily protein [Prunus dulcis]|uniref:NAD(P)-binding Rossmann-fold superfamily protein n=1 Tax=Prunus dulcis TaxID=3755 RepID=A0A5H2XR04_PRUDU|nr:NAD(P)-binding Rossmann-fold superfamily protein [Prunus dulcis]